ncbi:MAG TPA: acetyl-CoA carboxylase biotin carboxyl carrier protein [Tepidisphaeraceae bacterium]|nr:acetyl-CoA carboxylase biotin carboxyl carrier protein [Tepidisphaeraceae bacterium]
MSEKRNPKKARPQGKAASTPANSPIDFGLLAQIVELMSANDLNTVDVRDGDRRVILKRGAPNAPIQMVQAPSVMAQAPAAPPVAPASAGGSPASGSASADESSYHKITSPMVGTFYASPKPGEKAFVTVGSTVNEETDVCIIEAMKTFNNIKAECRGTISRIVVQDGQPVEFGTVLFLVKPS